MLLSILIVSWNTRELTLACLGSLANAASDMPYEVIVVDNGSVDGSAEALSGQPGIELLCNDLNLGFAAAVNQAFRRSHGDYVLLLNSDVTLPPNALSVLARFLDEREAVAGIGPVYANPDGSPQPFHFRFPTFATTLANGSSLVRRLVPGSERRLREYRMLDDDFSRPRPVPQPSASCLLLRRSVLPRDQLLDERYPLYFNDVQLARSLADRRLELWVTPDAVAVHDAHASGLMLPPAARRRQYIGAVVRMLMDTEPFYKVWLYRTIVLVQNLALSARSRPEALGGRDLLAVLDGNPGPLPVRPLDPPTQPGSAGA